LLAGRGADLVVGPYHVLDHLGRGGQSDVYRARPAGEGHVVALKVIRSDLPGNPEAARQFLLEMEAMTRLDHPNIVQFWDADQCGDSYYCAMEHIEGTDLGKYVRLMGPLPAAEACDYIRQAALGLQHAHEQGLIHRDIKPANLFLVSDGVISNRAGKANKDHSPLTIKILDWGLAGLRPPRKAASPGAAEPKVMVGTADYLSPEQALSPAQVDIRGDLYSLGCTLYFLLTGQPPFPGGTVMEKILRHQEAEPTPLLALRPDLPVGPAGILERLLAKRPMDRFQTPAALAIALTPHCRTNGNNSSGRPRPRPPSAQRNDDTPRRTALGSEPSTTPGAA
jgi:serine/threonine-protein kinase